MRIASKRLGKELTDLKNGSLPQGCTILQAEDFSTWVIQIETLGETIFQGEKYALRFRFSDTYPLESPEVVFLTTDGWKAPEVGCGLHWRGWASAASDRLSSLLRHPIHTRMATCVCPF